MNPSAPALDQPRLGTQLAHIIGLMSDGRPRTIPQICREIMTTKRIVVSETGAAARLREARKHGWTVTTERTAPGSGLYQYTLTRTTP